MDKDLIQGKKDKVKDIAGRMRQHVSEWTGDPELAAGKLPAEPKDGREMSGETRDDASGQTEYKLKKPVDRLGNSKAPSPEVEPPGGRNPDAKSTDVERSDAEIEEDRNWAAYGDRSRRKAS